MLSLTSDLTYSKIRQFWNKNQETRFYFVKRHTSESKLPKIFSARIYNIPYTFLVEESLPSGPYKQFSVDFDEYRVKLQGDSTTPADGFAQVSRYLLEKIQVTNIPIIGDFVGLGRLARQVYNNKCTIFTKREIQGEKVEQSNEEEFMKL
jgi:hypothetical protein